MGMFYYITVSTSLLTLPLRLVAVPDFPKKDNLLACVQQSDEKRRFCPSSRARGRKNDYHKSGEGDQSRKERIAKIAKLGTLLRMLPPAVETLVEEEARPDGTDFDADADAPVVAGLEGLVDLVDAPVEVEANVLSVVEVLISMPGISPMSDIPPIPISIEVDVADAAATPEAPDTRETPDAVVEAIAFAKYEKEEILSICSSPFFSSKAATWVSTAANSVELEHCPSKVGPSSETTTSIQLYMKS